MKKVLLFGEKYFNYTDSVAYALRKLGYDVNIVYVPLVSSRDLGVLDYFQYKFSRKSFLKSFYEKKKLNLINELESYRPDLFFSINGNAYYEFIDESVLTKLTSINSKKILWYMDTIRRFERIAQNIQGFDHVFSFEPGDIEYIQKKYLVPAEYLPIGVSEELYCKSESQSAESIYDICFVGNTSENRLEVLERVAEYCYRNDKKFVVYGHYWHNKHWWQGYHAKRKFVKQHPYLAKYVTNSLLNGKQVAELYNKSKICLNIHIALHKGINPRTFEIMGGGNFELCDNRIDGIKMGIVPRENIAFYHSSDECIALIDYYLKNDEERKMIADNSRRLVEKRFTLTKLLLEKIGKA